MAKAERGGRWRSNSFAPLAYGLNDYHTSMADMQVCINNLGYIILIKAG